MLSPSLFPAKQDIRPEHSIGPGAIEPHFFSKVDEINRLQEKYKDTAQP